MRYALQNVYVAWILISTAGLMQALACYYGWDGLSFFRGHRRLGYVCSVSAVAGSYYWFFALQNRNVPGLEGWQLFSRFAAGALAGIAAVLLVSSVLNASMATQPSQDGEAEPGLDQLRNDTFAHLMQHSLSAVVRRGAR